MRYSLTHSLRSLRCSLLLAFRSWGRRNELWVQKKSEGMGQGVRTRDLLSLWSSTFPPYFFARSLGVLHYPNSWNSLANSGVDRERTVQPVSSGYPWGKAYWPLRNKIKIAIKVQRSTIMKILNSPISRIMFIFIISDFLKAQFKRRSFNVPNLTPI